MKMHVCDLCKHNKPDAKIKYKYRAIKAWRLWHQNGWEKIELCKFCLDKIIEADKAEGDVRDKHKTGVIDEVTGQVVGEKTSFEDIRNGKPLPPI